MEKPQAQISPQNYKLIILYTFTLACFGFAAVTLFRSWQEGVPFNFPSIVAGLLGLALLNRAWKESRSAVTEQVLGALEVTLSSDLVRVGEEFDLTFRQTFKRAVEVQGSSTQLILRESATYTRGTTTSTVQHENIIYTKQFGGGHYAAGSTFSDGCNLRIPADGMHTFKAANNDLEWFVRLTIQLAKWPDIIETKEVEVVPQRVI